MIIKIIKKKLGLIIKAVISLVLVLVILISLINIRQSDKKRSALAGKPIEEYYMELPEVDYGKEGFKVIAENDKLCLLADIAKGEVALKDNNSGKIWYTNPQDRENDKLAVMATRSSSQIVVKFIDIESGNETTVDSYMGCVLKRGLDFKISENGIKFIYRYPNQGVVIPVEYTLYNDSFEAKILIDEIEEQNAEAYKILNISLLPFFAAGGINDSGYMFVPDGSGALINYNNGKTNCAEYEQPIYGSDILITDDKSHEMSEKIRIPVFGNKTNDQGFLGIVTSGEASGIISSTVSGILTGYNQVYASVDYRDIFVTELDRHGQKRKLKQYGVCNLSGNDFAVRYYPLEKEDADYSGMARTYRKYLKETGVLNNKINTDTSLALELYGAIRTPKNVLGVQKEVVTPLSDYSQLYSLCENLTESGVNKFTLFYKGWNNGGLGAKTNSKILPEKELGGKRNLLKFLDYADDKKISVYLDCDLSNLYKNGNGISHVSDAAKLLTQDSAKLYDFKYASVDFNEESYRYLIKPALFEELSDKLSISAKKFGIKSMVETTFGDVLYSDCSKKKSATRYETQEKVTRSLKLMKERLSDIAVTGGNIYAAAVSDTVFDAPTKSSQFDIVDETVPFYSMALHGYINLTTDSINFSETPEKALLKAVETGCIPKYTFIHGDTSLLIGTKYSDLFNVRISDWYDKVVSEYNQNRSLFERISALEINCHKKLEENIYFTEYEDGTVVTVNYGNSDAVINNVKIPSLGYVVSE